MNWEQFDKMVEQAKKAFVPDHLRARHIVSTSTVNPYYSLISWIYNNMEGPVFEIGCDYGCAAACALDRGKDGYRLNSAPYFGIDIKPVPYAHDNFHLIYGDSNNEAIAHQLAKVAEMYGGFSCVFQDSSHYYEESKKEWELYSPMVRKGGIWMADDILPSFKKPGDDKGMVEYWNELPGEKRLYDDLHIGSRIGVLLL